MTGPTTCAIHQPNLFPRLSVLAKLYTADIWVILDDVQYNNRDYQHRTRVAQADDPFTWQWLSLPAHRPTGRSSLVTDIKLVDQRRSRHRIARLLHQRYGQSPHWSMFSKELQPVLDLLQHTDQLVETTEASTLMLLRLLGWHGEVRRSSALPSRSDRSQRLADLAECVGASTYYCGTGGRRYLDVAPFTAMGIDVAWFEPPSSTDQEHLSMWSNARQISAAWAMLTFGFDAVGAELRALPELAAPSASRPREPYPWTP